MEMAEIVTEMLKQDGTDMIPLFNSAFEQRYEGMHSEMTLKNNEMTEMTLMETDETLTETLKMGGNDQVDQCLVLTHVLNKSLLK